MHRTCDYSWRSQGRNEGNRRLWLVGGSESQQIESFIIEPSQEWKHERTRTTGHKRHSCGKQAAVCQSQSWETRSGGVLKLWCREVLGEERKDKNEELCESLPWKRTHTHTHVYRHESRTIHVIEHHNNNKWVPLTAEAVASSAAQMDENSAGGSVCGVTVGGQI